MKTVFSHGAAHELMLNIKLPVVENLTILASDANPALKFRALLRLKDLVPLIMQLPEPTFENVAHENTRRLIRMRDQFFMHHYNVGRDKPFRAIWKFCIILYDYDEAYSKLIDECLQWWLEIGWDFPAGLTSRPSPQIWNDVPADARTRMATSIDRHYVWLQEKLLDIQRKMGDSPEAAAAKLNRYEQFQKKLIQEFGQEVLFWKGQVPA